MICCSFLAQLFGAWPFCQEICCVVEMIRTVPRLSPRDPSVRTHAVTDVTAIGAAMTVPDPNTTAAPSGTTAPSKTRLTLIAYLPNSADTKRQIARVKARARRT